MRHFLFAALSLCGCAAPAASRLAEFKRAVALAATRISAKSLSPQEAELVAADLAFAADAGARGAAAAFASQMLEDGKLFPQDAPPCVGPEGARKLFAHDKSQWWWSPEDVRVDGSLGVTWGMAAIAGRRADGSEFAIQTRYVTVWKRDEVGRWKIWLDVGTRGPGL